MSGVSRRKARRHENLGVVRVVEIDARGGTGGRLAGGIAAEVKSRLNIVDVIGESVQLKKAGTTFKGLCPFHGEKTPSFTVTPARDSWKCFGCGLGGDIFSFVMQRDSVPFPEALRQLANKAGVEIDERTKREDAHRARLRDILETSIAFYHQVLTATKLGAPALDYLRGRGFTDATIEAAQLGWAPDGWDTMSRRLVEKRGIKPEELVEVGLASQGRSPVPRRRRHRPLPRPRPLPDPRPERRRGRASAAGSSARRAEGGRDTGPKYLNSPATPLFDKSRTLYLIDKAKGSIRKSGQAVIVEGYTDALMAHQAGFDNVVASLGTALTPGPGRPPDPLREADRPGLRRRCRRPEGRDVRRPGPRGPHRPARGHRIGGRARRGPRRPPARRQGSRRGRPRVARISGARRSGPPSRSSTTSSTPTRRRTTSRRPAARPASSMPSCPRSGRSRTRSCATAGSSASGRSRASRSGSSSRSCGAVDRRPGSATPAPTREGRFSADAVTAAPDALRVGDILRGVLPQEQELLRLMLLVPEVQVRITDAIGPDQLPNTVARELFRAVVLAREPDDAGRPPAVQPDRPRPGASTPRRRRSPRPSSPGAIPTPTT